MNEEQAHQRRATEEELKSWLLRRNRGATWVELGKETGRIPRVVQGQVVRYAWKTGRQVRASGNERSKKAIRRLEGQLARRMAGASWTEVAKGTGQSGETVAQRIARYARSTGREVRQKVGEMSGSEKALMERMLEARNAGAAWKELAERTGRVTSTLQGQVRKYAIRTGQELEKRGGLKYRWTDEELQGLLEERNAGAHWSTLGRRLGARSLTVRGRVERHARRTGQRMRASRLRNDRARTKEALKGRRTGESWASLAERLGYASPDSVAFSVRMAQKREEAERSATIRSPNNPAGDRHAQTTQQSGSPRRGSDGSPPDERSRRERA